MILAADHPTPQIADSVKRTPRSLECPLGSHQTDLSLNSVDIAMAYSSSILKSK